MIKLKSLLLKLLVNACMSLIILYLSKKDFNAYFGRQLKQNAYMIEHVGDYMANVKGELKLISKHASMVTTQVEQVIKAQNDLLNELNNKKNDNVVRVVT